MTLAAVTAGSVLAAPAASAGTSSVRDGRDDVMPRLDLRRLTVDSTRERLRAVVDLRGLRASGAWQLTITFDDTQGRHHSAVATRYRSGATATSWMWKPTFGGGMERCPRPMDVRYRPARDRVVLVMPRCHGKADRHLAAETSRPDAYAADRIDVGGRL